MRMKSVFISDLMELHNLNNKSVLNNNLIESTRRRGDPNKLVKRSLATAVGFP